MRAVGALSWVLGIVFYTYGGGVEFTLCCGYRFRYLRVDKTVECGEPLLLYAGYRFRYPCLRGAFSLFGDLMSWVSFSIPDFILRSFRLV